MPATGLLASPSLPASERAPIMPNSAASERRLASRRAALVARQPVADFTRRLAAAGGAGCRLARRWRPRPARAMAGARRCGPAAERRCASARTPLFHRLGPSSLLRPWRACRCRPLCCRRPQRRRALPRTWRALNSESTPGSSSLGSSRAGAVADGVALARVAARFELGALVRCHLVLRRHVERRHRRDDAVLHAQIDQRRAAFAVFEHLREARFGPAPAEIAVVVEALDLRAARRSDRPGPRS